MKRYLITFYHGLVVVFVQFMRASSPATRLPHGTAALLYLWEITQPFGCAIAQRTKPASARHPCGSGFSREAGAAVDGTIP